MGRISIVSNKVKTLFSEKFIAFLCGGGVWMLLDVHVSRGGVDASFVSACMDTVMAVAALGALIKAGKYINQKLHEDSYKYALALMVEYVPKTIITHKQMHSISYLHLSLIEYMSFLANESSYINNAEFERERVQRIASLYYGAHETLYKTLYPLNQEIQFSIYRLKKTGGKFSNGEHGDFLREHFMKYAKIVCELEDLLLLLNSKIFLLPGVEARKVTHVNHVESDVLRHGDERFVNLMDVRNYTERCSNIVNNLNSINRSITKITKDETDLIAYFSLN